MSVVERLNAHYEYAKTKFDEDRIIGLFLAGSQNYGTALETSDVDSKLLITPTLDDIYANKRGENCTLKMPDDSGEQIAVKDIRCAIAEFKKQNLNMLEILFTDYKIINPLFEDIWGELETAKEQIAKYDKRTAVRTTKGIALNAYERLYSQEGFVRTKQVANLVRLEYYLKKYIDGAPYLECIHPIEQDHDYIMQIRNNELGQSALQYIADNSANAIKLIADTFAKQTNVELTDSNVGTLLDDCCEEFVNTALIKELAKKGVI